MEERPNNEKDERNRDFIDDITKEIRDALESDENITVEKIIVDKVVEEPGSAGVMPPHFDEMPDSFKDFDESDDEAKTENEEKDDDADSIDETLLKDAEMDMTDDQKEEKRIVAEELKVAGNNAFKDGDFEKSAEKYTEGLRTCPLQFTQQRSVLYCNRSAAKMKMEKYKQAAKDCTKALELDDKYMKAYIRRAQSYEATGKLDESLEDYKKILELDPSHQEAQKAVIRLPPLIEEKNEKLKTEMMGKLKDLGNMILKPFGLSTENFQLEQDPDTKGYKINFKQ